MASNNSPIITSLENEEHWLKNKCHLSEGPYLRPFAPNTKWREASVFIVGLNPATPFKDEFNSYEHYWNSLTRFPEQYYNIYRGKYKKSEEERSRTSQRIRELLTLLSPLNVLVTNVYAYPTVNPLNIPTWIRKEPINERILVQLFSICKPRVLFFHGREARIFANKYFGVELNPSTHPYCQRTLVKLPATNNSCWLFAYHHLVGRVDSKEVVSLRIKQFAEQILHCANV